MKSLFQRLLYGGTGRLRDYELACLEATKQRLTGEGPRTLQAQIDGLKLVQRFSDDRMVVVHYMKEGDALPRFAARDDELRIATVTPRGKAAPRCGIVLHRGRLSSLEFSADPSPLRGAGADGLEVQLHEDPSVGEAQPAPALPAGTIIPGSIAAVVPVTETRPPATESEIAGLLSRIAAPLPEDLLRLLREANGFRAGTWTFLGTHGRSLIVREGGTLHIVVENDEQTEALAFEERQQSAAVKRFDEIADEVVDDGASFVDALLRVLRSASR